MEQLENLLLPEAGIGIATRGRGVRGDGLPADGGGAGGAGLGPLEVVVVGAEEERAGRGLNPVGYGPVPRAEDFSHGAEAKPAKEKAALGFRSVQDLGNLGGVAVENGARASDERRGE